MNLNLFTNPYNLTAYILCTLGGLLLYYEILKPFFKHCVTEFKLGRKEEKARKQKQEYANGYGWAMAEVQLDKMEIIELYAYTSGFNTSDSGAFDDGIEKAIDDLEYFHQLIKDRMDTDDYEALIANKGDA